ncbi:LAQU0S20e00386g1_1 [Lachancea quebecensis]|uniref:LAQU0S20e00386g1_1 n=1 Tax=Lachancea quebecensis TaxID=1654605 RepID=A0A0P1KWY1_9SACH|nr:LAQU0S20e00386g1_1 [Lachancea quebecensis]
MDYEDELSAPVWDDQGSREESKTEDELSKTFANLSTDPAVEEQKGSGWNAENIEHTKEMSEAQGHSKDLISSLAPEEDPLSGLSASEAMRSPQKGEALFGDSDSAPLESHQDASNEANETPSAPKNYVKPNRLFSSARLRRHPLTVEQKKDLFQDPLASSPSTREEDEFVEESLDYESSPERSKTDILREVDAPLFKVASHKNQSLTPSIKKVANAGEDETQDESEDKPLDQELANNYAIEVLDPLKVGDLTSAHVEYTIFTKDKNQSQSEFKVQRRYRDFRWLYRQLQNNHWGKIIPPPPEKQTMGRFENDFIENRRLQMERMLTKIVQDEDLRDDADFKMFLQSNNFSQDSKVREHLTGSNASGDSNDISEIHISEIELLGQEDAANVMKSGGLDESHKGFMNISFASAPKYNEPDSFFVEQRQATELLEEQLRQLCKSLEIVDVQRNDLASVTEEFAQTIKALEELEVSKKGSELLANFADVHLRIKESLQRSTLQETLTLGITIGDYLRSLSSIRAVFNQRSKLGYYLVIAENDLAKKQSQLEKNSTKGPSDKVETLSKEVTVLQARHSKIRQKWQVVGDIIRKELQRHERDKMIDFRNSIEIFLESSIETQKECIELWETFYQNNL